VCCECVEGCLITGCLCVLLFVSGILRGLRCAIAVSASKVKFCTQFFGLLCKLYLGPFCSRANSCSENAMSVLFMTLG